MASYAYDREIIPYSPSDITNGTGNVRLPKKILRIRTQEAKSLYQSTLHGSQPLPIDMEFTFMTNLLYQENRNQVVSRLLAEARYFNMKKAKAQKMDLEERALHYENESKIAEGAAQYLKEIF